MCGFRYLILFPCEGDNDYKRLLNGCRVGVSLFSIIENFTNGSLSATWDCLFYFFVCLCGGGD
jgi:hypothetical protein